MDIAIHIASLAEHGHAMAEAAQRGGSQVEIPTCPGWAMRDLVRHTGGVHRWATRIVATQQTQAFSNASTEDAVDWSSDAEMVEWFRDGVDALVETLSSAPADLECWTFMPAPSALAFWARRQAHEIEIHRVDAEVAIGGEVRFDPELAADGIDELLVASLTRRGRGPRSDPAVRLLTAPTDSDRRWLSTIAPDAFNTETVAGLADCAIKGTASDLYQFLWNRLDRTAIRFDGDDRVLDVWADGAKI